MTRQDKIMLISSLAKGCLMRNDFVRAEIGGKVAIVDAFNASHEQYKSKAKDADVMTLTDFLQIVGGDSPSIPITSQIRKMVRKWVKNDCIEEADVSTLFPSYRLIVIAMPLEGSELAGVDAEELKRLHNYAQGKITMIQTESFEDAVMIAEAIEQEI